MSFTISAKVRVSRTILDATIATFWTASVLMSAWLFYWRGATSNTTNLRDLQKFTKFHIPDMLGVFPCQSHHLKDPITIYETMTGSLYKNRICANPC